MAEKRRLDDDETVAVLTSKKPRRGLRVRPENLPDGPWRRKVTRIKKYLIVHAKVKRQYAKLKERQAREKAENNTPVQRRHDSAAAMAEGDVNFSLSALSHQSVPFPEEMHHGRRTMMDGIDNDCKEQEQEENQPRQQENKKKKEQEPRLAKNQTQTPQPAQHHRHHHSSSSTRPNPKKHLANPFSKELALAEVNRKVAEAREAERKKRAAERASFRRAVARARAPSARDGKSRLGRESHVLLERVKRLVGDS